jgi:hypothetical protein
MTDLKLACRQRESCGMRPGLNKVGIPPTGDFKPRPGILYPRNDRHRSRSFLYRDTLDPEAALRLTASALSRADDGELYLQYKRSEAFGSTTGG